MAWSAKTSGTANYLRGIWGISTDPPTLTRQPQTPNVDPSRYVMSWSTASTSAVADIESLTAGGLTLVTNNAIQAGFRGSVVLNSAGGWDVDLFSLPGEWARLSSIPWSIQFDNGIEVTETGTIAKPKIANPGEGWFLDENGDNKKTPDGRLLRDPTVHTRCVIRLKVRRGQWALDPAFGSRLWEIDTTTDVKRKAQAAIEEALQPEIDNGSIVDVLVGAVQTDHENGFVYIPVEIYPTGADGSLFIGRFLVGQ